MSKFDDTFDREFPDDDDVCPEANSRLQLEDLLDDPTEAAIMSALIQRRVEKLFLDGGMSHEEVASQLGITKAKVKEIEIIALRKLKYAFMRDMGPDELILLSNMNLNLAVGDNLLHKA